MFPSVLLDLVVSLLIDEFALVEKEFSDEGYSMSEIGYVERFYISLGFVVFLVDSIFSIFICIKSANIL